MSATKVEMLTDRSLQSVREILATGPLTAAGGCRRRSATAHDRPAPGSAASTQQCLQLGEGLDPRE